MSTHRISHLALAAAVVVTAALALPAQAQSGTVGDAALANQVQAELLRLPTFQHSGTDLAVSAQGGQVMVTGWVAYQSDVEAARRVALRVPGVTGASTQLHAWSSDFDPSPTASVPMTARYATTVGDAGAEDVALAGRVQSALLADPHFDASDTDIKVLARPDGRVEVRGWIPYADDEALVRQIVRSVPGVTSFKTYLRHWSTESDPS
jgi:osmotically-inducible protein OsmY